MIRNGLSLLDYEFDEESPGIITFTCQLSGNYSTWTAKFWGTAFSCVHFPPERDKKGYKAILNYLKEHYGFPTYNEEEIEKAFAKHNHITW